MIDLVRLGDAWDEVDVRIGAEVRELLAVSQSLGVIPKAQISDAPARADSFAKYKICEAGDLVLNRFNAYRGAFGRATSSGMVSPDYLVLRPHSDQDGRYLEYLIRSHYVTSELIKGMGGIGGNDPDSSGFSRMDTHSFHRMPVAKRRLQDQRAIADYLDRETVRIDTLIAEQQRLNEMLRERRFALRVHVAIHGVRPATEIDSPLPWAARLPAHWRVVPLTSVARLESGHTPSRSREDWWQDCHIPWVSLHDVGTMRSAKYLHDSAQRISDAGVANSSARVLPAGTVALSRDATVGRAAIMGVPMATSQHFAAWVCGEPLDPEYLWVLFQDAMQPFFDSFQNGSTIRTIGMGDLKAIRIPLPPLDEQRHIVEYTDEHTAKIDRLIAETERFIELSRERRAALITAAVTGQINVREVA